MADRHDWTTPVQLRAHTEKLWNQGKLLAALCEAGPAFPLRLPLNTPDSRALADDFAAVRAWSVALLDASAGEGRGGYRVVLREVRHRVVGTNRLPAEVWLDTPEDAFALIGRRVEAQRFRAALAQVCEREPALDQWMAHRPLEALELAGANRENDNWPRLLDVIARRPGCYVRQIDLPGIDTKFIERHQGILAELFDLALPPQGINADARGQAGFARRYGFRDKPERVRLRFLDPAVSPLPNLIDHDITLSAVDFAVLRPAVKRVFVTENEVNFLAFPAHPCSMVLLGGGYGFSALAGADWLHDSDLHYWGDIDTHGFAILSQLRALLPHARSLLMDRDTLLAHRTQWVREPTPTKAELLHLCAEELEVLADLRKNRLGPCIRVEQERIGFSWLAGALERVSLN